MGSYESAVYYDYKTLWEQKKITKEVYETALAIDSDRDGLNIFEFNRLLQKYPEAEERKKNLIPDMDITFKDKLNYSIDKALPDHIENSPIISNKEKAKLKRRNLIAGSSAVLGLSGTTMMCLSKMNDLPRKLL